MSKYMSMKIFIFKTNSKKFNKNKNKKFGTVANFGKLFKKCFYLYNIDILSERNFIFFLNLILIAISEL